MSQINVETPTNLIRFNPDKLTQEAIDVLRSIFDKSGYNNTVCLPCPDGGSLLGEPARIVRFLQGHENCWKRSPQSGLYRHLFQLKKGSSPLVLFDLFWLNKQLPFSQLKDVLSDDSVHLLREASILSIQNDTVRAKVRCYPLYGKYFFFDPNWEQQDFVYMGWDSRLLVDVTASYTKGQHFNRVLDLCTGSGIQGLSLSAKSNEVFCADINPRAIQFVQANAKINGITNVQGITSDAFSNTPGNYDLIMANTPYVPGDGGELPIVGGDLGIEFTLRLIEQIPDKITDQGMAILYTSDPIVNGKRRLLEKVKKQLGKYPFQLTLIPLFRVNYPQTIPMMQHYDRLNLSGYDDCILIIQHATKFETRRRSWDWMYYQRTCFDSWLDWKKRSKQK
ncbi:class I SAM-dependent methyltransferase [Nitrosomonas sp.]|uniref:class I SAM-dependent methyltransferase n=1 Tax=Nitrosomonas sp. TaxID=42353 RepID=UPI00284678D9|nr:class I SAM-dependent methyltransferase [Nitrosomonas sp.]MDR4514426.1 class I SAM-dependent methyltransferase [Nitrosomonas sp.]